MELLDNRSEAVDNDPGLRDSKMGIPAESPPIQKSFSRDVLYHSWHHIKNILTICTFCNRLNLFIPFLCSLATHYSLLQILITDKSWLNELY